MKRSLDDLDVVIGVVSCFGVFLVALLLIAIAPQEHANDCALLIADPEASVALPHCDRPEP